MKELIKKMMVFEMFFFSAMFSSQALHVAKIAVS
jgi:hypothetical protein